MRIFPFRWSFSLCFKGAFLYFIMIFISLRGKRRNRIWIPSDEEGESMGKACASSAMTWWRCDKGHSFPMRVAFRTTREQSCPYCARRKVLAGYNDLATTAPDVAAEWHPTLNGELTPEIVMAGSSRYIWWQCPQGHVWRARVDTRAGVQHSGCPVCAGNCRTRAHTLTQHR